MTRSKRQEEPPSVPARSPKLVSRGAFCVKPESKPYPEESWKALLAMPALYHIILILGIAFITV